MQNRPLTKYLPYTLSTKFPLRATLGCCFLQPRSACTSFHFHDCTELVYCRSGSGALVSEDRTFFFSSGDVLFISPYMSHSLYKTSSESCRAEFIHVNLTQMHDPAIFPDIIEFTEQLLVPFSIPPVISASQHPVFSEIIKDILDEMLLHRPYFEMSVKGYCFSLVSMLKRLYKEPSSPSRERASLNPALVCINRSYAEDLSIPQLAALCNISETHFRRLFRDHFSMSPLEYLNYIRIRESCSLLSRRSLLISQAAELSGFRTLSSYNRKFQEIMGVSPKEWLRRQSDAPHDPYIIYYQEPSVLFFSKTP